MKLTIGLIICSVVLPVISQRIAHPVCPDGLKYIYVSDRVGWVGIGWAWTTFSHRLNNITLDVDFATAKLTNTTFLGSLKIIRFHLLDTLEKQKTWNVVYEIKFPIQDPLPDVTRITLNGDIICDDPDGLYTKRRPDVVQLNLKYNDYTKEEMFTTKLIKNVKPASFPINEVYEDQKDEFSIDTLGCGKVALSKIDIPFGFEGSPIPRGTWPWLVSVFTHFNRKLEYRCAATLISRKLVVTAAHCFFDFFNEIIGAEDVLLILGQYDLKKRYEKGSKIVYPENIFIHPNYGKSSTADSDIAVIVLPQAIRFTTYIRPACLWKKSDSESMVGEIGLSAAWGWDKDNNLVRQFPEQLEIPVVSNETCWNSHKAFSKISSETNFCAGWQNGTEGPCYGDSGGPLLFERDGRWTLRGILAKTVSPNQRKSCDNEKYVVFTDVAKFSDEIQFFENDS